MRKLAAIACMLLRAEIAGAQVRTSGNVFFGDSYYNTNLTGGRISPNGWEGSIEGKVLPFIGLVGDFSGHYGSESSANCTAAAHVNLATTSTSFATAVGGGLDYSLFRVLAWRFQADYVHTHLFSLPQENVRFSTGIVLRF